MLPVSRTQAREVQWETTELAGTSPDDVYPLKLSWSSCAHVDEVEMCWRCSGLGIATELLAAWYGMPVQTALNRGARRSADSAVRMLFAAFLERLADRLATAASRLGRSRDTLEGASIVAVLV